MGWCFYLFIHITRRATPPCPGTRRARGDARAREGKRARARRRRARGGGARAAARARRRDDGDDYDEDEDVETTSGRGATRAVVLVPGFLSDWRAYADVAEALERSLARATGGGVVVDVARVAGADWWPTLAGGDFSVIVDAIDACVRKCSAEVNGAKVCVVAHSAGGWLTRLYLGSEPYCGKAYRGEKFVDAVVTLGAPHASMERYPFGRVPERRRGEGEASSLPEDARGSSLAYTNLKYPGAFYESVRYVNVVGDVVAGSPSFDVIGALCDDDDENTVLERLRERWSAYVVGVSYAANCGDASARGDGVCPVATALSLDGAENVILPGVYHGANIGDPWYGSPDVIDAWSSHCLP